MNYSHDTSALAGRRITDVIRARAYQIYEARRCQSGHALEDWLQAEHEIKLHLGFEILGPPAELGIIAIHDPLVAAHVRDLVAMS